MVNKMGEETQDEIYYYPLINGEDIVLVLSVFNTTDGWSYSLSEDMVSQLNYIDFENNQEDYVLYYEENQLIVESENGVVTFPEEDTVVATFDSFALLPASRSARATYSSGTLSPLTRRPGYYPSYKINESTYKECKLYCPQGQGDYGRCWAAACATMLNYEFGLAFTAQRICDLKGVDYNAGVSSVAMRDTLVEAGLDRRLYYEQLAWGDIITEINNKRPIGVCSYTEDYENAHAVTVVGYRRILNYCYVILWNSALNENSGGTQVATYDEDGTAYPSDDKVFIWTKSIAK